jgi:ribosomal protein L7/L12
MFRPGVRLIQGEGFYSHKIEIDGKTVLLTALDTACHYAPSKVGAIKLVRSFMDIGLKEAKDIVEFYVFIACVADPSKRFWIQPTE